MTIKNLTFTSLLFFINSSIFASNSNTKILETKIQKTLNKYCVECHDDEVTKGDIELHDFIKLNHAEKINILNKVEEQVFLKQMPPKKEKLKPSDKEREEWLESIKTWFKEKELKSQLSLKIHSPKYGNYIEHEKLFSGEYKHLEGFTYNRDWVISEFIFARKVSRLLGTSGEFSINGKITPTRGTGLPLSIANPFLMPKTSGVRYYAKDKLNSSHFLSMVS